MMEGTSREEDGGAIGPDDASKRFECPVCKMSFVEFWRLASRHFLEHQQTGEIVDGQRQAPQYPVWKGYECNFCHRLFDKLQDLQRHYEQRRQMMKERKMARLAKKKDSVGTVAKKLKGLKLGAHTCKVCDKRFKSKSSLTNHLKLHSKRGEGRRVKCHICKRTFASPSNLKRHKEHVHFKTTTGFKCTFCDEVFSRKDNMKRHQGRIHRRGRK